MSRLLVLGDSVTWGQGLLDAHKFSTAFRAQLATAAGLPDFSMLAHSGASIGWDLTASPPPEDPEVPVACPTIRQQADGFGPPNDVNWVIVNGGINDVDIKRLLNPVVPQSDLDRFTTDYCRDNLSLLMDDLAKKFTAAQIYVVGYYPILSYQSDPLGIEALYAAVHAMEFNPLVGGLAFKNAIVDHCLQFWKLSTTCMQAAVASCNGSAGAGRCVFVDTGFDESNAVFAPNALLWGVEVNALALFPPQDEVAARRAIACGGAQLDPVSCFTCQRASAGHPNVAGAAKIAAQLAAAVSP